MGIGRQNEVGAAVTAVAHGATVIEKHFTLARADGGVDSTFSLKPHELAAMVTDTERVWQAFGRVQYGPAEAENASARFRRSLYIAAYMKPGDVLTAANLRVVRPGYGLAPKYYDLLLGRRVNRDLKKGTAVDLGVLG